MSFHESLDQFEDERFTERTLLLTWLCIFTWVGSWFIVLYYSFRIVKINNIEGEAFIPIYRALEYSLMKISIIAAIVSGVGAYFMWHQRKAGFFIYLVGQIALSFFGLYVYLIDQPIENPTTYYYVGFYVVQLGFIVLYSINWKLLNNTR